MIAAIASGSQAWNGNWAAFEKPASAMRAATMPVRTASSPQTSEAMIPERLVVPVVATAIPRATSRLRPPAKVSSSVRIAPGSPVRPARAMRKKDARDTSSQAMKRTATSSARNSRTTETMNADMST